MADDTGSVNGYSPYDGEYDWLEGVDAATFM